MTICCLHLKYLSRSIFYLAFCRGWYEFDLSYLDQSPWGRRKAVRPRAKISSVSAELSAVRPKLQLDLYRTQFFGHKFELSGLLHSGFLPVDTCVMRTA